MTDMINKFNSANAAMQTEMNVAGYRKGRAALNDKVPVDLIRALGLNLGNQN